MKDRLLTVIAELRRVETEIEEDAARALRAENAALRNQCEELAAALAQVSPYSTVLARYRHD